MLKLLKRIMILVLLVLSSSLMVLADLTGPQKIFILRVRFNDYPDDSRYTQADVKSFLDNG